MGRGKRISVQSLAQDAQKNIDLPFDQYSETLLVRVYKGLTQGLDGELQSLQLSKILVVWHDQNNDCRDNGAVDRVDQ